MNPQRPFDLAPKDGDFAGYVERLVAQSEQRMREAAARDNAQARDAQAPEARRLPGAGNLRNADMRNADMRGTDIRGASQRNGDPRDADLRDRLSPAASVDRIAERFGRRARDIAGTTMSGAPGATGTRVPAGPPDLSELLSRLFGRFAKVIGVIGAVWLLLGAVIAIPFFADTLFIAMMLIFAAIFVHNNQRRRRAPTPPTDPGA